MAKDKFYFKLLAMKAGKQGQLNTTLQMMRQSGADVILLSKTGSGVAYMNHAMLIFKRAAKAVKGVKFDAVLQRENTKKVYGVANGVVFVVEDPTVETAIQHVTLEPVSNFRIVDIPVEQIESKASDTQPCEGSMASFNLSVKNGFRGSDISDGGRTLAAEELSKTGWESSVTG